MTRRGGYARSPSCNQWRDGDNPNRPRWQRSRSIPRRHKSHVWKDSSPRCLLSRPLPHSPRMVSRYRTGLRLHRRHAGFAALKDMVTWRHREHHVLTITDGIRLLSVDGQRPIPASSEKRLGRTTTTVAPPGSLTGTLPRTCPVAQPLAITSTSASDVGPKTRQLVTRPAPLRRWL
jgi:hypothetical protein